nr:hypothetical protein [Syntrophales bacterium]
MELWRRVVLLGSILAALLTALHADLSPVVIVQPVDFAAQQKKEGSYLGVRLMTERNERLAGLPLHDYIAEATKGRLFHVTGRGWETTAQNAAGARDPGALAKDWQRRLPSDRHPLGVLFFRPSVYLKAQYRAYSDDDFHLGSGFTNYPTPPTGFLYPGRTWSPWVAVAGLVLYIALPWPKRPPEALAYKRWRVVLCDVAALILTVPFFAFPFLI